jgi:hypothetical protein
MQRSRIGCRGKKASMVIAMLAVAAALSCSAQARELLPFPSQQQQAPYQSPAQQSAPLSQSGEFTEFSRSISGMDCSQLQNLRTRVSENQRNASTTADQGYFAQLIRLIDQHRNALNCPSG